MAESGSAVSAGSGFLGFLNLRRNQVVSMEQGQAQDDLDLLQAHVADHLSSILPSDKNAAPFVTLPFLSNVLDALLAAEGEFRALLVRAQSPDSAFSRPPLDRLAANLLDRAVKSLDVCNAVSLALHALQHWHRHAALAASALLPPNGGRGDGPLNRARRALNKLVASGPGGSANWSERGNSSRSSFGSGRNGAQGRTLSSRVSRNWSAGRQVQAMTSQLFSPRSSELATVSACGDTGMALAVYTMSSLLAFTMWILVAAVPCQQERGASVSAPSPPPKQLRWASAVVALQERMGEECRRRDRNRTEARAGMLSELQAVERCGRALMEAVEETIGRSGLLPDAEDLTTERARELAEACRLMEEGLGPLERQVREVFHRVVGCRAEVLPCVDQTSI